jgi:hypothetical protein
VSAGIVLEVPTPLGTTQAEDLEELYCVADSPRCAIAESSSLREALIPQGLDERFFPFAATIMDALLLTDRDGAIYSCRMRLVQKTWFRSTAATTSSTRSSARRAREAAVVIRHRVLLVAHSETPRGTAGVRSVVEGGSARGRSPP